jgi:dihydrofolate reductase
MGKLILFMHISLDGFCAGPKGEMNWITIDEEIFDYGTQFIEATDTALYGRTTYEMMEAYWPTAADQPDASKHDVQHAKWYKQSRKVVLSSTMQSTAEVKIINNDLVNEINELKQESDKDILLFGSPRAAYSLLKENLFDGYWFNLNPILLGNGIPVFNDKEQADKLKLVSNHVFSSGVIALH